MKRLIVSLMMLSMVLNCGQKSVEKFSYEPRFPKTGDTIVIKFNTSDSPLSKANDISMILYEFADKLPKASEIELSKRGKIFSGKFVTDSSTKVAVVEFESGEQIDNNDEKGYSILLHNSDGKVVEGGYAMLARIQNGEGFPLELQSDPALASKTLKKEFEAFPDSKESHRDIEWSILMNFNHDDSTRRVLNELNQLTKHPDLPVSDLNLLARWFARLGLADEAETYEKQVLMKEPLGELAEDKAYSTFVMTKGMKAKLPQFIEFQKKFPNSSELSRMTRLMLDEYLEIQQYDGAMEFLENISKSANYQHYNQIAWTMAEKGINLATANRLAAKGVELARQKLATAPEGKPVYITDHRWKENLRQSLGSILDTQGFINLHLENINEAATLLAEAVDLTNADHNEINERFATALVEIGNDESAYEFLDKLIKSDRRTPVIDDLFKKMYVTKHGSDKGLEAIFQKVEKQSLLNLEAELNKEILNYPAPPFQLSDLGGSKVSSDDVKGKIVVLDFWATWCSPCIQSMPGMQKIVDQNEGNDAVEFLFINAWERGDDKVSKVKKFMDDRGLTMQVLMDFDNVVIADYKVEGIPTKFIIDSHGNVRFKIVGYGGNEAMMIKELTMMIDMIR